MTGHHSPDDTDHFFIRAQHDRPTSIAAQESGRILREPIFELFQAPSDGEPAAPEHLTAIAGHGVNGFVFAVEPAVQTLTRQF